MITKDLDETKVLEAQIRLTQFSITIINDLQGVNLQGVNPALFKIGMENILFGMNVVLPIVCGDKLHSEAIIESILHTSFTVKDEKRFLITPRPYGVEDSCGVSISFRLRNDLGYSQLCRAGETQFFKFEYAMDAILPFPSSWKSEDNKSGTVIYRMAQQTHKWPDLLALASQA